MTQIPHDALIVIADGGGAKLFRNGGSETEISLKAEKELTPKNLAHEGPSGSRPEDQTPRQTDEATFAKQLAQALNTMAQQNAFAHLVVAADPQTLGQLRASFHKSVEDKIILSLPKNLTNHSAADIAEALS